MDKSAAHTACYSLLDKKIERLRGQINDAQQAASDNTKSSAGDKFETGREMMKREIDKLSLQLSQASRQQHLLEQIDPNKSHEKIGAGSLVHTSEGIYYFSVPVGKISTDQGTFFALSLAAPIGKALQGKQAGDLVHFMQRQIKIESVQ